MGYHCILIVSSHDLWNETQDELGSKTDLKHNLEDNDTRISLHKVKLSFVLKSGKHDLYLIYQTDKQTKDIERAEGEIHHGNWSTMGNLQPLRTVCVIVSAEIWTERTSSVPTSISIPVSAASPQSPEFV